MNDSLSFLKMSEDDIVWKWNKFVQIGNRFDHAEPVERTKMAQDAFNIIKQLRPTGFIVRTEERYDFYAALYPKMLRCLDANNTARRELLLAQWNQLVDVGTTIHTLRGDFRIIQAKRAIEIAKHLVESKFFMNTQDALLFDTLLSQVAEHLDGNAQVIQEAVKDYFFFEHGKAGLERHLFGISFAPKRSGIQTGFTCNVSNGTQTTRYYVKTHQHDEDNVKSMSPPDAKEFFVYKLLHAIGMGPEPHFIIPFHGTKRTIYIATKECHLKLLSDLNEDTSNHKALLQLDLMSRILCIQDVATNTSNCGQVGDKPMIVDFRVVTQQAGYVKADIVEKFYKGNCEFSYTNELMIDAVKASPNQKFIVMKSSLQEWNLVANMDQAKLEIDRLIENARGTITFRNDLETYVKDLNATIDFLINATDPK